MAAVAPRQLQIAGLALQLEDEDDAAALAALVLQRRLRRRQREFWVKPWISRRPQLGDYENLMAELERESRGDFVAYLRMEPAMFHELVQRLTPRLTKKNTKWRRALEPGLKVAVTLRFLATGNSYHSLAFSFRVAHNTISRFVHEVCQAILDEYGDEVVSVPTTEDGWRQVSEKFGTRWNFHNTMGAMDGKHIAIKAPRNSGSLYYNYKGFFSIILLGVVDGDYKFLWVDVGANGSTSDCAVFNNSAFKEALEDGTLGQPPYGILPGDNVRIPYFLIGDDAFPMRKWLMKPYSNRNLTDAERIFNYRLSRARRIVENAFGIMANRFRCLLTTLQLEPDTVQMLVLACVCLHNIMRLRYPGLQNALLDREADDHQVVPGAWRDDGVLQEVRNVRGASSETRDGKRLRVYLKNYYNNIGAVPWQGNMI